MPTRTTTPLRSEQPKYYTFANWLWSVGCKGGSIRQNLFAKRSLQLSSGRAGFCAGTVQRYGAKKAIGQRLELRHTFRVAALTLIKICPFPGGKARRFANNKRQTRGVDTRPFPLGNAGHAAVYYRYGGLNAGTKGPGDIRKAPSVPPKVFWG